MGELVATDGELIITVADSGPGIDTEEIDAIFHLGTSAKAAPAGSGGRGFGLVLVRQAVTRLGGDLEVESDGGAIFTVTLPLTADRPGARVATMPGTNRGEAMMADERELRVLIVEDDPMTAEAHADFVRRVPSSSSPAPACPVTKRSRSSRLSE